MSYILHGISPEFQSPESSPKEHVCVMLHGLFGMSSNLLSLAKGISSECSPILYDLPNHGESPSLDPCDFISMAHMLHDTIQSDELSKHKDSIHLIGHSLGGKLAMVYALLYPQHTSSLIVMDIAPIPYPPYHKDIITGYKQVMEQATNRKDALALLTKYAANAEEAMFLMKNLDFDNNTVHNKLRIEIIEKNYDALLSFPRQEIRGIYKGPMLLLRAKKSEYFVANYYEEIESYFPGWELEEVPDSGHNIHVDNFAFTVSAIKYFYQQIL